MRAERARAVAQEQASLNITVTDEASAKIREISDALDGMYRKAAQVSSQTTEAFKKFEEQTDKSKSGVREQIEQVTSLGTSIRTAFTEGARAINTLGLNMGPLSKSLGQAATFGQAFATSMGLAGRSVGGFAALASSAIAASYGLSRALTATYQQQENFRRISGESSQAVIDKMTKAREMVGMSTEQAQRSILRLNDLVRNLQERGPASEIARLAQTMGPGWMRVVNQMSDMMTRQGKTAQQAREYLLDYIATLNDPQRRAAYEFWHIDPIEIERRKEIKQHQQDIIGQSAQMTAKQKELAEATDKVTTSFGNMQTTIVNAIGPNAMQLLTTLMGGIDSLGNKINENLKKIPNEPIIPGGGSLLDDLMKRLGIRPGVPGSLTAPWPGEQAPAAPTRPGHWLWGSGKIRDWMDPQRFGGGADLSGFEINTAGLMTPENIARGGAHVLDLRGAGAAGGVTGEPILLKQFSEEQRQSTDYLREIRDVMEWMRGQQQGAGGGGGGAGGTAGFGGGTGGGAAGGVAGTPGGPSGRSHVSPHEFVPGGSAKLSDEAGRPIDAETMQKAEELGKAGNVQGLQQLFASRGYRMSGPACGIVASKYARSAGFEPPKDSPIATRWHEFGQGMQPGDINQPGHPFGSMFATYFHGRYMGKQGQVLQPGELGGHVMSVVPGTYDPKTGTIGIVDQYGFNRRSIKDMDLRFAGAEAVAAQAARAGKPGLQPGSQAPAVGQPTRDWSDLHADVRRWEGFHARAYADVGGTSIGYGTGARPGQTIGEPAARQAMEAELQRDRAAIERINPNLSEGSKKALSSLLYNLGGDVNKLYQHGMYRAIVSNDVEGMKKAHLEFSHIHGPSGPILPGLLRRRQEELKYYDQGGGQQAGQEEKAATDEDIAAARQRRAPPLPRLRPLEADAAARDRSGDLEDARRERRRMPSRLDVNVSAPKGTKVKADGGDVFTDVKVRQAPQMGRGDGAGWEE
jgi:GH24 family phage-related lysozyme (muramidase)